MGFAFPALLLLLAAVAGPVIAHLRRHRELPRVPFPTVALLRMAMAHRKRRFRMRDPLLLALRVLVVVLAALAAAQPFLWENAAFADGQRAHLVLVVDDSLSTEGAWNDIVARGASTLEAMSADSRATLIAAGAPARVLARGRTPSEASAALETLTSSDRTTDLEGAARLAAAEAAPGLRTRLLVLSDFPKGPSIRWPAVERRFERHVSPGPNRGVLSARATSDPTQGGRLSVRAEILAPPGALRVHAENLEGEVLDTASVDVGDDRRSVATLSVAEGQEALRIRVEAAEGETRLRDNTRELLLAEANARVLIVDGSPARQDARFLRRALRLAPPVHGGARIASRTVDEARLPRTSLEGFEAMFLVNARRAPGFEGSTVLTCGARVQRAAAEAPRFGGRIGAEESGDFTLDRAWPGLEGVRATKRCRIDLADGTVAMRWSDGVPALVLHERTAILGVALDDEASNLPYQPGFLPMVHRLLSELGGERSPQGTFEVGAEVPLPEGASIEGPDGERTLVQGTFSPGRAGVYGVRLGGEESRFVVQRARSESIFEGGEVPDDDADDAQAAGESRSRRPIAPWFFLAFGLLVLAEGILRERPLTSGTGT